MRRIDQFYTRILWSRGWRKEAVTGPKFHTKLPHWRTQKVPFRQNLFISPCYSAPLIWQNYRKIHTVPTIKHIKLSTMGKRTANWMMTKWCAGGYTNNHYLRWKRTQFNWEDILSLRAGFERADQRRKIIMCSGEKSQGGGVF